MNQQQKRKKQLKLDLSLLNEKLLAVFFVVEKQFAFLFRTNLCLFLRYVLGFSETTSIFYFHLFELTVYLTVFSAGQLALYTYKPIFFFTPWPYVFAFSLFYFSIFNPMYSHYMILISIITFAFTHGLNLSSNLNLEYELRNSFVRKMMLVSMSSEAVIIFTTSFVFFLIPLRAAKIFMTVIMIVFMVVLVTFQVWVIAIFFGDKRKFSNYGPWKHISCIFYRFFLPLQEYMTAEGRYLKSERLKKVREWEEVQKKKKLKLPITKEEEKLTNHWLDPVVPPYPEEIIKDMKYKVNYWKIMSVLPGMFISFELRYSFWMFSVNRLNRHLFAIFPTQSIMSFQQLFFLVIIPFYSFFIGPIFRRTWFRKALRKMGLGGFIILGALGVGLHLSYMQETRSIRTTEPYFDQTKVAIRNGLNCEIAINRRYELHSQQSRFSVLEPATMSLPGDKKLQSVMYEKYWESVGKTDEVVRNFAYKEETETEFIFPMKKVEQGDTSTLYLTMNDDPNHPNKLQSLTIFPINCTNAERVYNIQFRGPLDNLKNTQFQTLILIQPAKVSLFTVPFTRDDYMYPGVRFFFANQSPIWIFEVWRGPTKLYDFPELTHLTRNYYYFYEDDGLNLKFKINSYILRLNTTIRIGGLYDFVFIEQLGAVNKIKIYEAETPHVYNFSKALIQYGLMALGEFFFGVLGLRFMFSQTPHKLHFQAICDWYLMYAFSNLFVIIIMKCGLFTTTFWQLAVISIICTIAFILFIVFSLGYTYQTPPEPEKKKKKKKKIFEDIKEDETGQLVALEDHENKEEEEKP